MEDSNFRLSTSFLEHRPVTSPPTNQKKVTAFIPDFAYKNVSPRGKAGELVRRLERGLGPGRECGGGRGEGEDATEGFPPSPEIKKKKNVSPQISGSSGSLSTSHGFCN